MIQPNLQTGILKNKLKESGCSQHQASILFKEGLLSFEPEGKEEFEVYEIEELRFLKCLFFDSSLSANLVKAMLTKLKRPYSYSFENIYWDYGIQDWKELQQDVDDYIKDNLKEIIVDNFDVYLENVEDDDLKQLTIIKDAIEAKLKK
jgi:hypothetical protein